jgi:hypothetical protein
VARFLKNRVFILINDTYPRAWRPCIWNQDITGSFSACKSRCSACIALATAGAATALYVPSIGLVVAGDAVYNGIHPYLTETSEHSRLNWIAALESIEALKPRAVVAGHKRPENSDSPQHIAATQHYIRDFNRLNHETTTTRELYDKMLSLYPDRVNPGSLWGSAKAAKAEQGERQ